jgi:hypothetical protein
MAEVLIEVPLFEGGPTLLIETTASEGVEDFRNAAAQPGLAIKAHNTFSETLSVLQPTLDIIARQVASALVPPKSAVVELGVKFGAKGNIIIAGGETEANLKLTLTWDLAKPPAGKPTAPPEGA